MSRDDPPISPSPSFSSVFHSSCFLHKAGVSRDSSQMFSAAHHIAFLMKYSWSLSASCHESLLQLPAMETLRRQHSCKAPGPLLPARHLHLPLPPPTRGAGARLCPSRLAGEAAARARPEPRVGTPVSPGVCPRRGGSLRGWEEGADPGARRGLSNALRIPVLPVPPVPPVLPMLPVLPVLPAPPGSQPARGISDAVHYNPIRLFMQTIRFYVLVKSLNNLNQSERPGTVAGGGCGLVGGGRTLCRAGDTAWLVTLPGW